MIDLKDLQKDFLNENYINVIEKINQFKSLDRGFTLSDLCENNNDIYTRYLTKGVLLVLLDLDYIKIISCYNGYKNYTYLPLKDIEIKNKLDKKIKDLDLGIN